MSNTTLALFSGLVGSILTVTIGKILELVQESKKHKYSLKRVFFEKKLASLEAAVRLWYKSAEMTGMLSALLAQISKKNVVYQPIFYSSNTII